MRKRIAFISEHASPLATLGGVDAGGQNVYVAELARYLSKLGFQVDVFTRRESASIASVVHWMPDVRVVHVTAGPTDIIPKESLLPYMTAFRKNMMRFMEEEDIRYDLIHANFWMSALVAMEIKEIMDIPYVITFHALGHVRRIYQKTADKFPPERLLIEEEAAKRADKVLAECPQDREDLINYYNVDPSRITIVPCGFCPDEFYPVGRAVSRTLLGLNQRERIILQLGRMVPRKGVDNVIRSMRFLKDASFPVRLLIVGGEQDIPDPVSCPEIARLQHIAEEEGVGNQVTFAGRKNRDVLKYYYAAADVFVTTPWYEPFGITPLESMACGTPVIGANVGGIKYSVVDGQTGYLVPPNEPLVLAEKVKQLLDDARLLRRMQLNAMRRVNNLFTWSRVSQAVAALYESVLEPCQIAAESNNQNNRKQTPVIHLPGTDASKRTGGIRS